MIGLRVRQVRELLGWTQTGLAEKANVSQALISQIESGEEPSDEVFAAISRATGFPVGWFVRPGRDELPDGTIRYRKTSKATKREDRRAVRRLEVAGEVVHQLIAELPSRRTPPVTVPFLGAPDSPEEIEAFAAEVREALGAAPHGPMPSVIRAAERAGAVVIGLPVDTGLNTDMMSNHHGISAWPALDDRPLIGFSTNDPGDRQRHTIAHEIGHLVMHRGVADPGRDYESEASRFAGALLMPMVDARQAFSRGLTLATLTQHKRNWGVSIAGLIMRAAQLNLITRERQTSLFKQLSARGFRKNEPVVVHREEPALLARLLDARFGEERDWIDVGRALNLPPHLARELAEVARRDVGDSPTIDLTEHRRRKAARQPST